MQLTTGLNKNYSLFFLILFIFVTTSCTNNDNSYFARKSSSRNSANRQDYITSNQPDLERSAKFNVQLGLGYLDQGDVERAKNKFLKALKQDPVMPEAHYNIAHFYYLIDEKEQAEHHFNKAIEYALDNKSSSLETLGITYNNYGVFLCQTGQYKKANQYFMLAANDSNYSDTASAYENAGLCAQRNNDKKMAEFYYEKAIKQNPLSAKALIEMAQIYVDTQRYQKAKFYLQRYNQVSSNTKRSLILSYQVAAKLNDQQQLNELTKLIESNHPDLLPQLLDSDGVADLSKLNSNNKLTIATGKLGKLNKIT